MLKNIPFYSSLVKQPMFDNVKSTQTDVLIYGAIEVHSMGHLGCIASNDLISREIGLSVGTVANGISKLNKAGWVKVSMDNNNHRMSIEPLLEIATPIYKTLHSTVNPPSLHSEPPLHSTVNIEYISKVQLEDNLSCQTGKQIDIASDKVKKLHLEICSIFKKQESRYKLSDKRKKKLEARIKDCGEENIIKACTAISNSKWHMGENDRHWVADPYWCLESYDRAESWFNRQIDRENLKKRYTPIEDRVQKPKVENNFNPNSEAYKKFQENRKKLLKGL